MPERKTHLSCAQTAKLVRSALRAQFPGVKLRVRSRTYAGGASIDVTWTDGPTTSQVRAVTCLYEGASFDGMADLKNYHDTLLADEHGHVERVHLGADFIHCNRHISQHTYDQVAKLVAKLSGIDCDLSQIRYESRQRVGYNGAGWNTRYPLNVWQGELCGSANTHEYGYELAARYLHHRDLRSGFPGTSGPSDDGSRPGDTADFTA
jgi:Large polyvalent protein associated domain 29